MTNDMHLLGYFFRIYMSRNTKMSSRLPDEVNSRIRANSILFPISKAWHEDNAPWNDAIRSYESAISKIPIMLETDPDSIANRYIDFGNGYTLHFKMRIINSRLVGPNETDACKFYADNMRTPGLALANGSTYVVVLIGDVEYEYLVIRTENLSPMKDETYADALARNALEMSPDKYTKGVIPEGYVTAIPLMIGSKWCATQKFPYSELIRAGEDFTNLYGNFIIGEFLRYLQPTMTKPLNKALVQRNNYDKQISRVEVQYSRGCEYEHSYYIVASCLRNDSIKGNGSISNTISVNDYGFSLQMNHSAMNQFEGTVTGSNKKLINFVPIKPLFAAFGCTTDGEMLDYICPERDDKEGLVTSIHDAILYGFKHAEAYNHAHLELEHTPFNYLKLKEKWTQELALYVIGTIILRPIGVLDKLFESSNGDQSKYREAVANTTRGILDETFMPAIDSKNGIDRNRAVCFTIGFIVRDLYLVGTNLKAQQFKSSLENKRIRWGQQISKEFKAYHTSRIHRELYPAIKSLGESIKSSTFDQVLVSKIKTVCISMGEAMISGLISSFNGTGGDNSKIRNALVEPKSAIYVWNKLREVMKHPSLKQHGVQEKWSNRRPHPSEAFFLDPIEGPDSSSIGKFRTLCVHTRVTIVDDEKPVLKWLKSQSHFKNSILPRDSLTHYVVSVNGSLIGYIPRFEPVEDVFAKLMQMRRTGELPLEMSVVLNNVNSKLDIWLDAGRIIAPFVIVKNAFDITDKQVTLKKPFAEWLEKCNTEIGHFDEGIRNGFIDFLDCDMIIQNWMVAASLPQFYYEPEKYTHISIGNAIDGIVIAAASTGTLNLPNRAQISTNHLKQAAGYPIVRCPQLLFINNMDILLGAQQPIIQPHTYRHMHMGDVAIGNNIVVAFMFGKYNQEDAVILNRQSVENGLLEIDTLTTIREKKSKSDIRFEMPPLDGSVSLRGDISSYSKLGKNSCLPNKISSTFNEKDALMAKCRRTATGVIDISKTNKMPSASSSANPRPQRCVECHYIHERSTDQKLLTTGEYRVLIDGDKCNFSINCQKNTIGRIIDPENMPHTADGIVPDAIFGPVSIFKRKTYGMSYESMFQMIASYYGCFVESSTYGTSRTPFEIEDIVKNMGDLMDGDGFVTMYDPDTGEAIPSKVFVGVSYYQRQHHLVETKLNVRCGGPRDEATNQPTKGKRKMGGTKFDRMSCDALTSSGASSISIDFHLNGCNKVDIGICQHCHGVECYHDLITDQWKCPTCGYHSDIDIIQVPMASVQLNQLLTALHFKMKVNEEK